MIPSDDNVNVTEKNDTLIDVSAIGEQQTP